MEYSCCLIAEIGLPSVLPVVPLKDLWEEQKACYCPRDLKIAPAVIAAFLIEASARKSTHQIKGSRVFVPSLYLVFFFHKICIFLDTFCSYWALVNEAFSLHRDPHYSQGSLPRLPLFEKFSPILASL